MIYHYRINRVLSITCILEGTLYYFKHFLEVMIIKCYNKGKYM